LEIIDYKISIRIANCKAGGDKIFDK